MQGAQLITAKLGILAAMSGYGFDADYVLQREAVVNDMTIERIQELAHQYMDPHNMVWLVVGDAATQRDRLEALGLGEPIDVDRSGERVQ